eukprot:s2930_g3.t1
MGAAMTFTAGGGGGSLGLDALAGTPLEVGASLGAYPGLPHGLGWLPTGVSVAGFAGCGASCWANHGAGGALAMNCAPCGNGTLGSISSSSSTSMGFAGPALDGPATDVAWGGSLGLHGGVAAAVLGGAPIGEGGLEEAGAGVSVGVPASGKRFVPAGKVSGSEAGVGGVFAGKGSGRVASVGEGGLVARYLVSVGQLRSALRPYSGPPGSEGRSSADQLAQSYGYFWSPADLVCALLGAMDRQGLLEFFMAVPLMLSIVPIYKHAVLCNAWIYDLTEVFILQWSDPLRLPKLQVQEGLEQMIAAARLDDSQRQKVDQFPFLAYHQYPPADRSSKTVAGMQFAEADPAGTRITLLSHTSHPYDVPKYVPRSSTGEWSAIVVYLQSWNPWYHLAGVVEVNYRKDSGLEHAMWLVVDPSSKLAALSLQSINELFVDVLSDVSDYLLH